MALTNVWTTFEQELDSQSAYIRGFAAAKTFSGSSDFSYLDECLLEGLLSRVPDDGYLICIARKEVGDTECTGKCDASIACPNAGTEPERADRGGLHDDVKSQGTRYSVSIEISLQGENLAAFDASEVGSGERDRTVRRWQAHHGARVGTLHEPLG